MITREQLKSIVPAISEANLNTYLPLLNAGLEKFQMTSKERTACFIPQVAHECDSFKTTKEYASGKAYEGRRDLGNVVEGDGARFKGRGLIQCTGRTNYGVCSRFIFGDNRLLQHPELLELPENAVMSAFWYWSSRSLNDVADLPDNWIKRWHGKSYDKFQWLTIKINGGLNGYADRLAFYNRAKKVL